MEKSLIKAKSKRLSYILRHRPDSVGLQLDHQGWASVEELLECLKGRLTREELEEIVRTNNKQRFAFNEDCSKIRANQGHSIKVDLAYEPQVPPDVLYHGTVNKAASSIKATGLKKMNRHHVHLSVDVETALDVGSRRGKPVLFCVDAKKMHEDGYKFFKSENNVWLTDSVPVDYLKERK